MRHVPLAAPIACALLCATLAGGQPMPRTDAPPALRKAPGEAFAVAYPAKPLPVEKTSAEELAQFIARAAGLKTHVLSEKDLPAPDAADAYVGATDFARAAGLTRDGLKPEAYVIRTRGSKLLILGDDDAGAPFSAGTRSGTLFGVYDFLENDLGVTWIWPGKTGEYVPRRDGLALPAIDRAESPAFLIRAFVVCYGKYEGKDINLGTGPWLKRMRLSWTVKAWFGHSWGSYVLGKKELVAAHPEWLALWGGERRGPHLCTSNKALREHIVECVLEDAKKKGNKIVSISPSDGYGFCECENCRALDPPGTDYGANSNLSNRHWDYANAIAREVKKRDANLGVGMFAYTAYRHPPTNIDRLEDNLYVSFTFTQAYFIKPEMREETYRQVEAWKAKGIKIIGREYWGMHYWLDLPYLFTRDIAEATPYLYDRGLVAMYGETGKNYATQGPNYYLAAHLMWRPHAAPGPVLDRFYAAFGPARDPVRKYYESLEDTLHRNADKALSYSYRQLLNCWPEIFPAADIARAGAQLAEARKAVAGQAEFEERLKVVEVGYEYTVMMVELLGLYRQLGRAGVPLWNFGVEGDAAEAIHYKLPGNKMLPEVEAYWAKQPRVTLTPDEKLRLLRRARELGEERERILNQYADLPAVSRGLYQFTIENGIRPWHKTVMEELKKAEGGAGG
jgi:hypothetical protein